MLIDTKPEFKPKSNEFVLVSPNSSGIKIVKARSSNSVSNYASKITAFTEGFYGLGDSCCYPAMQLFVNLMLFNNKYLI